MFVIFGKGLAGKMTPYFVIIDTICRSGGIAIAVAVPLFGLADLVEVVLAD
jgi:hypothetical protein